MTEILGFGYFGLVFGYFGSVFGHRLIMPSPKNKWITFKAHNW
jgi:hypothetical protein